MISDLNALYVIAAALALIAGGAGYLIYFTMGKERRQREAYDAQLEELLKYDYGPQDGTKITLASRWNAYWRDRAQGAGIARYQGENAPEPGREFAILSIAVIVLMTAFLRNPLPGLVIVAAVLGVAGSAMKSFANRESEKINAQLPGFLFALKANIQANETPERAILKVTDGMPSPLHEELLIVKKRILANATFKEAVEELAKKTSSRDLRFLCACIVQATGSGANLENQLTVIQGVLDARRKVSSELDKAVRSATPAIWVASFVIPGTFIAMYMLDPSAREFWFNGPLSWAALFAVVALYSLGVFLAKKLVDSIRNL